MLGLKYGDLTCLTIGFTRQYPDAARRVSVSKACIIANSKSIYSNVCSSFIFYRILHKRVTQGATMEINHEWEGLKEWDGK